MTVVPDYIRRVGHVALRVPDLDASVRWATTVMGLRETERVDGCAYLTHADCHHSLQYIAAPAAALDHVALEAHDDEALDALVAALRQRDVTILATEPRERGIARAVRFPTPAGHVIEVFTGMQPAVSAGAGGGAGIRPRRFGHPMLTCEDTGPTVAFFLDVLGFRLSDDVGDGTLVFMRCNVEHHGVGVGRAPRSGLNHYAWGVENLAMLGALGDVLAAEGASFLWGPGRHGAGENLFTYHFDPAGFIVEYYADMYQVWDERSYVPGRWRIEDPRAHNLWGAATPQVMAQTAVPIAVD